MTETSLRSKIVLYFVGLIFVSSLSTIIAVMVATNAAVEEGAKEKLLVGEKVYERLQRLRTEQHLESAKVLTSDFGFKSAVLTGDPSTLDSVLDNYSARIDAELMLLASLQGDLLASTVQELGELALQLPSLIVEAQQEEGFKRVILVGQRIFQVVLVPIKAPITSAWAMIGFEIDQDYAQRIKSLIDLEVVFFAHHQAELLSQVGTISLEPRGALLATETPQHDLRLSSNQSYYQSAIKIEDTSNYQVSVSLASSIEQALAQYYLLKVQIVSIAILGLLFSSVVGYWMSSSITRPVRRLAYSAERISAGDYTVKFSDQQLELKEIARLANSLDHMQQGIAGREEQILYQVNHDSLTDLLNRVAIKQRIDKLVVNDIATKNKASNIPSLCFGLMHINVKGFKSINDTFGYHIGDQVLVRIAEHLSEMLDGDDLPCRLGADEFLLLLHGDTREQITAKFEHLAHEICGSFEIGDLSIPASFNSGLSVYPDHGERPNELLRRADIAYNEAVAEGRWCKVYQPGSDESHRRKLKLINDLKQAIEQRELSMNFQPKLDLQLQRVTQVEALVRWIHPTLGFVPPSEFIPLAEQSGLMPALTRSVIHSVISESARWREQGLDIKMAINLSAYDLSSGELPAFIDGLLKAYDAKASDFIFEVTESAMMENPEQALCILHELKTAGFSLAVDDYGTGFSSLSQLKDMPVDEMKIDMSFVLKLDTSPFDQAVVQSTIEMAHKLGLTVVAEGVENQASWDLLAGWGCDKLQGYYISKPQNPDDFIQWFQNFRLS